MRIDDPLSGKPFFGWNWVVANNRNSDGLEIVRLLTYTVEEFVANHHRGLMIFGTSDFLPFSMVVEGPYRTYSMARRVLDDYINGSSQVFADGLVSSKA